MSSRKIIPKRLQRPHNELCLSRQIILKVYAGETPEGPKCVREKCWRSATQDITTEGNETALMQATSALAGAENYSRTPGPWVGWDTTDGQVLRSRFGVLLDRVETSAY